MWIPPWRGQASPAPACPYNNALGELHRLVDQLAFFTGITVPRLPWIPATNVVGQTLPYHGLITDTTTPVNPLEDYFAKQKQQYDAETQLARKSYLPRVVLGAGGWVRGSSIQYSNDYKSPAEGLGYQRLNYLAGVGITYDLFNGTHRRDGSTS